MGEKKPWLFSVGVQLLRGTVGKRAEHYWRGKGGRDEEMKVRMKIQTRQKKNGLKLPE